MAGPLREYEMVEGTTAEEAGAMKQRARIEAAQRLRRQAKAADEKPAPVQD